MKEEFTENYFASAATLIFFLRKKVLPIKVFVFGNFWFFRNVLLFSKKNPAKSEIIGSTEKKNDSTVRSKTERKRYNAQKVLFVFLFSRNFLSFLKNGCANCQIKASIKKNGLRDSSLQKWRILFCMKVVRFLVDI